MLSKTGGVSRPSWGARGKDLTLHVVWQGISSNSSNNPPLFVARMTLFPKNFPPPAGSGHKNMIKFIEMY